MKDVPLCFVNYLETDTQRILPQWKCNHSPNSLGSLLAVIDLESSIRVNPLFLGRVQKRPEQKILYEPDKGKRRLSLAEPDSSWIWPQVSSPQLCGAVCHLQIKKKKNTENIQQLAQSHPTCRRWNGDVAVELSHSKLILFLVSHAAPNLGLRSLASVTFKYGAFHLWTDTWRLELQAAWVLEQQDFSSRKQFGLKYSANPDCMTLGKFIIIIIIIEHGGGAGTWCQVRA